MSAAATGLDPRSTTPVSDLSETGVFVHTDQPLEIGASVELCFTVFPEPTAPALFQGKGRVVRHAADGDPPGMGVEFETLDETARDVLRKILLRDEAKRQSRRLAKTDETLRTHGLVARLLQQRKGS